MKLRYDFADGIGRITLAAPPRNLLDRPDFEDRATLEAFLSKPELTAVVVQGEGRHFCAGASLGSLRRLSEQPAALELALTRGKALLDVLGYANVPVLALIRGACLGAGLEIALACHFRMASENALLGLPEAGLGLMPGFGGTILAQEVASRAVAIDLALSGRMVGALEACRLGLVDSVEPTSVLEPKAVAFLRALVRDRPPSLVRAIMQSIHNARRLPRAEALANEGALFLQVARARLERGES
jgi:enoyl-CoA hydratase/carnithine racemase